MYCENCGNSITPDARFCDNCGHQLPVVQAGKPFSRKIIIAVCVGLVILLAAAAGSLWQQYDVKQRTSSFIFDNSRNTTSVIVRVYYYGKKSSKPLREVTVSGGGSANVDKLKAGQYEVRCRVPSTGKVFKSSMLQLPKNQVMTMTLYTVNNGNTSTFPIGEDDF